MEDCAGYSTRYDDSVEEFSPRSKLTVQEVEAVGRTLGLPEVQIVTVPIHGLCAKTDEENLVFTYAELDRYIRKGIIEDEAKKRSTIYTKATFSNCSLCHPSSSKYKSYDCKS